MSSPAPALLVAAIALVLALAGGAMALPGENRVDGSDIEKGAVTHKAFKKGAVTSKATAARAVTNAKLGDASVDAAKLAPGEAVHLVGAPGEVPFGNGGEGDCVWGNPQPGDPVSGMRPAGFYRDPLGIVRMQGVAIPHAGPAGDGMCNPGAPGESEDGIVFALPAGYEPSALVLAGPGSLITGAGGASLSGVEVPPNSVFGGGSATLDGAAYRAAAGATPGGAARISARYARKLGLR